MKKLITFLILALFLIGCGGGDGESPTADAPAGATVTYETPAALEVPEAQTVKSDTDWEAKVHNKEIEVLQLINTINPIAAFITAGFKQYGEKIKNQILDEEWTDTQVQLTAALKLYDSCKSRKEKKNFDKKLFLDMEEAWQLLVKTGVAGIRTKSMLDVELAKL